MVFKIFTEAFRNTENYVYNSSQNGSEEKTMYINVKSGASEE